MNRKHVFLTLLCVAVTSYVLFYSNLRFSRRLYNCPRHRLAAAPRTNPAQLVYDPPGTFLERVNYFNQRIIEYRQNILLPSLRHDVIRRFDFVPDNLCIVNEFSHGYLDVIYNVTTSLILAWSDKGMTSNTLVTSHFQWTANEELCRLMRTPGGLYPQKYNLQYNFTCTSNMTSSLRHQPLPPLMFNWRPMGNNLFYPSSDGRYPKHAYEQFPEHTLYMTVIRNAYVTGDGDVITSDGMLIRSAECGMADTTVPYLSSSAPYHQEVFVTSQYWGNGYFHRNMEVLPRLGPYVPFLRAAPGVRLHVPGRDRHIGEALGMLGVGGLARALEGGVRAGVVYLPQGSPCGNPLVQPTQLLAHYYRAGLHRTGQQAGNKHNDNYSQASSGQASSGQASSGLREGSPDYGRDRIIFIQRSGKRRLIQEAEVVTFLRDAARKYNLTFDLWGDRPVRGFREGAALFSRAVLVVAPHGAGEANLIHSLPGTILVELVCNNPHTNLCYQREADVLGMIYHAVISKRGGCEEYIDVHLNDVTKAVTFFLDNRGRILL